MKRIGRGLAVSAVLWWFGSGAASPQGDEARPQIYKLAETSTYQRGCFEPCSCPIMEARPVRGTFTLTPAKPDGSFAVYDVSDVNWIVPLGDSESYITGSGRYRLGGSGALKQQLVLDLVVGNDKVTRFDSGLVAISSAFPKISITISINGMFCFDTVIAIKSSPVPADQVQPYRLTDQATHQEGCFPPCRCALFPKQRVAGTFALVELRQNPLFTEYAVVNVDWRKPPLDGGEDVRITGTGVYRIGGEFAVTERLILNLKLDDNDLTRFDSGLVVGGSKFPSLDVVASVNGLYCYDQVIEVRAKPSRYTARGMK
jgi:hypothetical protein